MYRVVVHKVAPIDALQEVFYTETFDAPDWQTALIAAAEVVKGEAARVERAKTEHEVPVWSEPWPEKCRCPESGKWGATGVMPLAHHWQWRNAEHTSGYLAHTPDGPHQCEESQKPQGKGRCRYCAKRMTVNG